jgi:allantoin racemase
LSARVLVVNPNTSSAMTETIRAAAESAAWAMDIEVTVLAPQQGPQSVEGRFDEVVSAYWTVDAVLQAEQVFDGVAVACYGPHPAVEALREALAVPVMGVMEASVLYALPLCGSFSIVTTSPRWEPILRESIRDLGIEHRCASVRSSGLAVLDLDRLPPD